MEGKYKKEIKEWIYSLVIAAILAFTIKAFIFDIIQVSGISMVPTLHNNDRVIVEKISMLRKKSIEEKL
ncbi:S26 family signal peptidase [Caloramator sp. mosi_1]|uniref:S26 family signal peptidase n=1 Tax=Caloramator sp. mosi_1 TaxID=3023090 RepID=UPI003FCE0B82